MLMDELFEQSRAGALELDPFFYTAYFPIGTFIAGAALPINITINADSDFVIRNSMGVAYTAGPVFALFPNYTLTMFDTGSGRNLMDQATPFVNIMGNGQLPFIWSEPKLIAASSVLTITMTNNEAAAADVWLTFGGFKVFKLRTYNR